MMLSVIPDACCQFVDFPNGIAMVALGYSLGSIARAATTTRPTPVDGPRAAATAGAE